MEALVSLPADGGLTAACDALGVARATVYRHRARRAAPLAPPPSRPRPPRALTPEERHTVLDLLREPRFADLAPAEIYATLLDEGVYHCSIRTLYRILNEHAEVRERRDQLRHPVYTKPELLAEAPNQVWSWDITKLMGPAKWSYFYLYATLLDEGVYHCSIRTMYRILDEHAEVRERRDQLRHPVYVKPEVLAEAPNQVWSWDITKLMGPAKWTYDPTS